MCEYCILARQLGGKNTRKRSSVIINNDLLIDMGPDLTSASFLYGKPITELRYCLQTHPHSDHFDASHLATRLPQYFGVNTPPLKIYASNATLSRMSALVANEGGVSGLFDPQVQRDMNLEIVPVREFQSFHAGPYAVTAFPTDHDPSVGSLLYSVTENGFTIFYGTDTDTLSEETWQRFNEKRLRFDVVILDHTYGSRVEKTGHLNAERFAEHVGRFHEEGLLTGDARILATHISHEGNPPHDELCKLASSHGYEIAYDGLVVE
jgi:phosphoribosyl 1,2-cyclic phosphate phosphodiesterase